MNALSAILLLLSSFAATTMFEKTRKIINRKFGAFAVTLIYIVSVALGWVVANDIYRLSKTWPEEGMNVVIIAGSIWTLGFSSVISVASPYIRLLMDNHFKKKSGFVLPDSLKVEEQIVRFWKSLSTWEMIGFIASLAGSIIYWLVR